MAVTNRKNEKGGVLAVFSGLILGLATLGLLACGGGGGGGGGGPGAGGSFGIPSRVPLASLGFPSTTPNPSAVGLERAFDNLFFGDRPIYFTHVPDTRPGAPDWVVVCEQDGLITIFENDDDVLGSETRTFLDLSSDVGGPVSRATNEEGLLGFCVDPDFVNNGYFYVHYSASGPRRSIIERYTATFPGDVNEPPTASASTNLLIMQVSQPASNHNAGMIDFGPDGFLYIGFGDGGSGDDPWNNGQNTQTLLGSMLRIDVRNATVSTPYVVPPENPFTTDPTVLNEIWAYGFRNPWRFSFDRNTGDIWMGDVGQVDREEINRVREGENYGWRIYEGNRSNENPDNIPASSFTAPVIDYPRSSGSTVVGGYRYRGLNVPTIAGVYVYGDYGTGRIWGLVPDGTNGYTTNTQISSLIGLCSFGEDADGELYAVSIGGTIHRFVEPPGTPPPSFPATLSATGLFTDLATMTPAAGLIEYELNAPFWSDNAIKRRWVGIPGNLEITFSANEPWTFPVGTVVVKHFEIETSPGTFRRLETRVLLHQIDGWAGYTYRWVGADANLLPGSFSEDITIQDVGGPRQQTWYYPDRAECLQCHTQVEGFVLGPRTEQINRDFFYVGSGLTDNQLRSWNHIGLFDVNIGDPGAYEAYAEPADVTADLDDRARAYLATNCSQCHQPDGPAPGNLDFRYATPLGSMGIVNVVPNQGTVSGATLLVDPGNHLNSVLWRRMETLDNTVRMPRLGSNHVDQAGLDLVGLWIDSLGP